VTTKRLPPPPPPAADNVGGLFNQVQQLQQEVMRLNGVVEELSYEVRQLKEQSLERYLDIDRRLTEGGASPTGGSVATAPGSASPPATSAASEVREQPGEGEAYRSAYALVRGQEFDAAVSAFSSFLDRFPAGRYAPNAHYWLGELYLVVDPPDPESARQSFMLLLDQYPGNAKIPDALYKLGRVHFIKGNSDRAREFLNRVQREYPESSAARLASDFLDQNL
jgi:tol-pal system protein YbgF